MQILHTLNASLEWDSWPGELRSASTGLLDHLTSIPLISSSGATSSPWSTTPGQPTWTSWNSTSDRPLQALTLLWLTGPSLTSRPVLRPVSPPRAATLRTKALSNSDHCPPANFGVNLIMRLLLGMRRPLSYHKVNKTINWLRTILINLFSPCHTWLITRGGVSRLRQTLINPPWGFIRKFYVNWTKSKVLFNLFYR